MAAFAEISDVEARLMRELTAEESTAIGAILEMVSELIVSASGRALDDFPDPVPAGIKLLTIEKALQTLTNPRGLASFSEALGSASRSETYPRASDIGLFLSSAEERLIRDALYGAGRGSAKVRSLASEMADYVSPDPPV